MSSSTSSDTASTHSDILRQRIDPLLLYLNSRSALRNMKATVAEHQQNATTVAKYLFYTGFNSTEVWCIIEQDFGIELDEGTAAALKSEVKRLNKHKVASVVEESDDDDETEPEETYSDVDSEEASDEADVDLEDKPGRKRAKTIAAIKKSGTKTPATKTPATNTLATNISVPNIPTAAISLEPSKTTRVYVAAGIEPTHPRDPLNQQKRLITNENNGLPRKYGERYICYVAGCCWAANYHRKEVSPHFSNGAHPGVAYDVRKVLQISWDDYLSDEDLTACAAATNQEELYTLLHGEGEDKDDDEDDDEDEDEDEDGDEKEI